MKANFRFLTVPLFLLLNLFSIQYAAGQSIVQIKGVEPDLVEVGDTLYVKVAQTDSQQGSMQLWLGTSRMEIVEASDSHFRAITPQVGTNSILRITDTVRRLSTTWPHPIFKDFADTSKIYQEDPMKMFDASNSEHFLKFNSSGKIMNVSDLTGDGRPDVTIYTNSNTYILSNKIRPNWEYDFDTLVMPQYQSFMWSGDFDGGGLNEVVFGGSPGVTLYRFEMKNGKLSVKDTLPLNAFHGTFYVDINIDGRVDHVRSIHRGTYPNAKWGIEYGLNHSADTLKVDSVQFLDLDSLTNIHPMGRTDSNTFLLAGRHISDSIQIVEIYSDSSGLKGRKLYSKRFANIKTPSGSYDYKGDGLREVWAIQSSSSNYSLLEWDGKDITPIGSTNFTNMRMGPNLGLRATADTSYTIITGTVTLVRSELLRIEKDTFRSDVVDTLTYHYGNGLFADMNGDDRTDLLSSYYGLMFRSNIFDLKTLTPVEKYHFLFDSIGQTIEERTAMVINNGTESFQFDTIKASKNFKFKALDNSALKFPIILGAGDTLRYTIHFTSAHDSLHQSQVVIESGAITFKGPQLEARKNTNPSFRIKEILPAKFGTFDTVRVVLDNFRGSADSIGVFFGWESAKVVSLINDTLKILTPQSFNDQHLLIVDGKNDLTARSAKSYSMPSFGGEELPFALNNFKTEKDLYKGRSFGRVNGGRTMGDFFLDQSESGGTAFYRTYNGARTFKRVGSLPYRRSNSYLLQFPVNGDNKIDIGFHTNKTLMFFENTASDSLDFPFVLDTVQIVPMKHLSTPLHTQYVDVDLDGKRDLLYYLYEYQNSRLVIRSRAFDNKDYSFNTTVELPTESLIRFLLHDLNQDGKPDLFIYSNRTMTYYENQSRPGQPIFTKRAHLVSTNPSFIYRLTGYAPMGDDGGLMVAEFNDYTTLYLNRITASGDSIKIDSIRQESGWGKMSWMPTTDFIDLQGNGELDVVCSHGYVFLNRSDSTGVKFDSTIRAAGFGGRIITDFDGDGAIDFVGYQDIMFSRVFDADVWSERDKDIHKASYPFVKEGTEEPVNLYTSDSNAYSDVSKVYIANTGLARVRLTDYSIPPHLQISDSQTFAKLKLPIAIDSGQTLTLFIRNESAKKYGRFADTVQFMINGGLELTQVVESWIYDPPVIDSIRPVRAHQGDTVTLYGHDLLNHTGRANVLRTKERIVRVVSFNDSVYRFIAPKKIGSGPITISDTINLLGTTSTEKFELLRSGEGHTITASTFKKDTSIIGNVVGQLDPSDLAFENIELVDFDEDGQLDYIGMNTHLYGSVVTSGVQTNWDENKDENKFDFTNKHYGGSGRARTGRRPSYFVDDVNHDGQIDILTVDVGDCVSSNVTCGGFNVVSQEFNSTKNHAFYSYTQSYLYTGSSDSRGGQFEVYGDFNKDGIPDLIHATNGPRFIITSFADNYTHTTTPTNKETYVSKYVLDTVAREDTAQGRIMSMDVDGDGWEDIIDGGIIYRNVSDSGKFKFQIAYNMADSFNVCSVGTKRVWFFRGVPAYLNRDDKPDLFGTGLAFCTGTHSYVSLINKSVPGKIDFDFKAHQLGAHLLGELVVGDLNGDSLSDIVHFYQGDSIFLFTNQTDTTVKFAVNKMAIKDPKSAVIKDYDGDGDNDLVVTNFASKRFRINFYKNNALGATMSSHNVTFSIPENAKDSATLYLYSDGALDLDVDTITYTNNNPNLTFSPANGRGKQVVKSGNSLTLKFNYSGDSIGTIIDTVRILHNGPGRYEEILIDATTLPWPKVKTAYDTIRFGKVRVGDTVVKVHTIHNIGKDTLDISGATTGNFSYEILGASKKKVPPGDSLKVRVQFLPLRKSILNGNSAINHNGVSKRIRIRLEGEGIAPTVVDTMIRVLADIRYDQQKIDSFYLANTGNDTLNILRIDTSRHLNMVSWDTQIAPGDSGLVVYNYSASTYGAYTEGLTIHHDYFEDSTTGVSVSYKGLRGHLVELRTVHFQPTEVDSSIGEVMLLQNNGNDSLRIDSLNIIKEGHWFSLDSAYTWPQYLAAGDTLALKLKSVPTKAGLCFGELFVYSNSIEGVQNTLLHGSGIVDFDSTRVGLSLSTTVHLLNYTRDSIKAKRLLISNKSAFQVTGLDLGVAPSDSLQGSASFNCTKEFLTQSTGSFEWGLHKQNMIYQGFGIAPKVFEKKLINLFPPKLGVLTRDTIYVKNEGTDTLFTSNFTSSSLISIIDSFNMVLAGDSGRIILDYITSKRSPEQEFIYFDHNYYAFQSSEIELAYFGQSPGIFISKSTLDFGDKPIGPIYFDSVYIKNTGNFNLYVKNINMNGDTSLKCLSKFPMNIAPNDRQFVVFRFTPEARKQYNAKATFYHSATGDSSIINLRAKGIGSEVDSCWALDTLTRSINANQSFDFYFKNAGDYLLRIDSVELKKSARLSLVRSPKEVALDDSGRFTANLNYKSLEVQHDTIIVYHDNYKYPSTKIVVSYRGTDALGQLIPHSLDHGAVAFGKESSRPFTLKNVGDETLEINFAVYSVNQQFKLKTNPKGMKILPGDSIMLESIYTPSSTGLDMDTVEFWTNSQTWKSQNNIALKGTLKAGKLVILDQPKIAGEVEYGDSIEGVIRLRNEGSDTLSINKLTTAHPDLELVLAGPSKLDTMDISTINFKFRARNKKDTSLLQYTVTNTGLAKKVDGSIELSTVWPELILPDSFHFSNTQINTKNIDTFWLYNTGTDTLSISQFAWDKSLYFSDSMNFPVLILPNDSLELYLRFNPDKMGYHSDSLALSTNEYPASNPKVLVGGVAIKTGSIGRSGRYKNIGLKQNVPNPGYGHTSIAYHVSEREHVQLNLLDNSGKLIKTMFEGEVNPGEHQLELDLNSIASGVYYYTLEVDGLILKKRMLVQH